MSGDPKESDVAVMYSGGTDSTYTACLMADEFRQVHLLTFRRFGMFGLDNSDTNLAKLIERWGEDKFVRPRPFPKVDKVFRHLTYERYWRNLCRHGFFNLTTCGICKLAMHVRTIGYCLQHEIRYVRDGANRTMSIFPAQMQCVLGKIRGLYQSLGIDYGNPVYDYDDSQGLSFGSRIFGTNQERPDPLAAGMVTTGTKLYELGILPAPDVKGTEIDRAIQARCFQFVLFNVFVRWYYLQLHTYDEYAEGVERYYGEKIALCESLLNEYRKSPESSRLAKLLEG